MANEMRLIVANNLLAKLRMRKDFYIRAWGGFSKLPAKYKAIVDEIDTSIADILNTPTVVAVPVKQYKELMAEYNQLRENFVDFFCSGSMNPAPYCLNSCKECTDNRGWCDPSSDKCKGFNPADIII
jgi:hypothetical protein